MPTAKTDAFAADHLELAALAKALSHPARLAILETLAARQSCICGEIVEVLPLAQATVSQHLKALKDAGLVQGTLDGPRSCYCLNRDALLRARDAFERLFGALREADGSCC